MQPLARVKECRGVPELALETTVQIGDSANQLAIGGDKKFSRPVARPVQCVPAAAVLHIAPVSPSEAPSLRFIRVFPAERMFLNRPPCSAGSSGGCSSSSRPWS